MGCMLLLWSCGAPSEQAFLNAAKKGQTDRVIEMIDQGVNINALDTYGATAAMLAAYNGHADTVKALLENGADAMIADKSGNTLTSVAEAQGHIDIVDLVREYAP